VSSLAPAFLASAASIVSLQDEILANCQVVEGTFFADYLLRWSNSFGQVPSPHLSKQSFWGPSRHRA